MKNVCERISSPDRKWITHFSVVYGLEEGMVINRIIESGNDLCEDGQEQLAMRSDFDAFRR